MKTLLSDGAPVWLKTHDNPKRKLPYTLTLLGVGAGEWALIDTSLPNHIVAEGIIAKQAPTLLGYSEMKKEVAYGSRRSRIDILLTKRASEFDDPRACYVEVKNVTMASSTVSGRADFPDSQTVRGLKHLLELGDMVEAGHRCVQFYFLGRSDCDRIGIAEEIDPKYADGVRLARDRGVEFVCQRIQLNGSIATLGAVCPLEFS